MPPAVPSDSVGALGSATIRPASTECAITADASGWQPMMRVAGFADFRTLATPPIKPPPPTATYTVSACGSEAAISIPQVPCPAITSGSL